MKSHLDTCKLHWYHLALCLALVSHTRLMNREDWQRIQDHVTYMVDSLLYLGRNSKLSDFLSPECQLRSSVRRLHLSVQRHSEEYLSELHLLLFNNDNSASEAAALWNNLEWQCYVKLLFRALLYVAPVRYTYVEANYPLKYFQRKTRQLSHRKEDRAMRPIYGCPEKFWESSLRTRLLFQKFEMDYCSDRY